MPKSETIEAVIRQCKPNTPPGIIDIIATQMDRATDSAERIADDGLVVRDMRGHVVPHPAIKIEIDAAKVITSMLEKHKSNTCR